MVNFKVAKGNRNLCLYFFQFFLIYTHNLLLFFINLSNTETYLFFLKNNTFFFFSDDLAMILKTFNIYVKIFFQKLKKHFFF